MRRFLFGVVIASVTAAMPAWAFGGDREIAQSVMAELQQHKAAGQLKGFDIDLKVEDGVVYLTGEVASDAQRSLVERAAINEVGRGKLVSELRVKGSQPAVAAKPQEPAVAKSVAKPMVSSQAAPGPAGKPTTAKPMGIPHPQALVKPASAAERTVAPATSDAEITDAIIASLQQSKAQGELRGFDLDVSTINGDVWLKGMVANQSQKDLVLDVARRVRGVTRVVDDMLIQHSNPVRPVSTGVPAPLPHASLPQGSSMPVASQPAAVPMAPQAFAPSGVAGYVNGGHMVGTPVPMQGAGGEYGVGAPRYDQPNLPAYAWPSYAAHPNYAAVTYPKQYSPSAWPYIGPFYPYPQVPLGWRKVALEWDDGLWYLDFTSK